VESRNFDMRKQLLEYDDVANDQRRVIYQQRNELLESEDISGTIHSMIEGEIDATVKRFVPPESLEEQWDLPGLEATLAGDYQIVAPVTTWTEDADVDADTIRERIVALANTAWKAREEQAGVYAMRQFERSLMLKTLDDQWRDHLSALDHLRQGIHLRGYAQKNPKQEYKRESFELFSDMLDRVKQDVVKIMLTIRVGTAEDVAAAEAAPAVTNVQYNHADYDEALAAPSMGDDGGTAVAAPPFVRAGTKVGRNDPCPCGSGKKYKQCHGRLA
jgi:preprotein translocase subunit SecA